MEPNSVYTTPLHRLPCSGKLFVCFPLGLCGNGVLAFPPFSGDFISSAPCSFKHNVISHCLFPFPSVICHHSCYLYIILIFFLRPLLSSPSGQTSFHSSCPSPFFSSSKFSGRNSYFFPFHTKFPVKLRSMLSLHGPYIFNIRIYLRFERHLE